MAGYALPSMIDNRYDYLPEAVSQRYPFRFLIYSGSPSNLHLPLMLKLETTQILV